MRRLSIIALGLMGFGAAQAAPVQLTYLGTPLAAASNGGLSGVKRVKLTFALDAAPTPGKCVTTYKLTRYADGHNTLASLRKAGFRFAKGGGDNPRASNGAPSATICTDAATGAVTSGTYQMVLYYSNSVVSDVFEATNTPGGQGDTVALDVYLGGEVPQVYSNVSASAGSWSIQ